MDPSQALVLLAQHLQSQGARDKIQVSSLSTATAEDWRAWRISFETAATANGWNNNRARAVLRASLKGDAFRAVEDILPDLNLHGDGDAPDFRLALEDYEDRFLSQAGTDLARAQLRTERQKPEESIRDWHGRLRHLFMRAYPRMDTSQREDCRDMQNLFLMGLRSTALQRQVGASRPEGYTKYLVATEDAYALLLQQAASKRQLAGKASMNAMQSDSSITCWKCTRRGHMARDCPHEPVAGFSGASPANRPQGGRGGARGRGGSRGRGRGGRRPGRGGNRSSRLIAALQEVLQNYGEEDEEAEDHGEDEEGGDIAALGQDYEDTEEFPLSYEEGNE